MSWKSPCFQPSRKVLLQIVVVIILLILILSFVSSWQPSVLNFVRLDVRPGKLTNKVSLYEIHVFNGSFRSLRFDGLNVPCSCVDRPKLPVEIRPFESRILDLKIDWAKYQGDLIRLEWVAAPPHGRHLIEVKR